MYDQYFIFSFSELTYLNTLLQTTFYHQSDEIFEHELETIVDCVNGK